MDWDAVGALVEGVGSIGVIISVFYLASQIRKQTLEAQLAATRDLAQMNNDVAESVAGDRDVIRIYLKGAKDYESLDEEERLVFGFTVSRGMRIQEQVYLHSTHESVHASFYESIRARLAEQLAMPGVRTWWKLNMAAFSQEFRDHIAREFPETTDASIE